MAQELEIKLSLSPADADAVCYWLLSQPEARDEGRLQLENRYYDTPDATLNSRRIALRVRRKGDRYIQTLKTQGEFVDGAHCRQEWEWPLRSGELDPDLLADTPVEQGVDLAALQPVFETNFQRREIMLLEDDTSIEVALDSGEIVAGTRRRSLHEVELELKSGDPARLLFWAKALARQVPVFLNLISKAEQGYYLAGLHDPGTAESGFQEQGTATHEWSAQVFLHQLGNAWLLEEPLKVAPGNLSLIRRLAEAQDAEGDFAEVLGELTRGVTVGSLIGRKALGQLELLVAGAGSSASSR